MERIRKELLEFEEVEKLSDCLKQFILKDGTEIQKKRLKEKQNNKGEQNDR